MEQSTPRAVPVIAYLTTVDEIEQRSGRNFFWQLPSAQEDAPESVKNLAWARPGRTKPVRMVVSHGESEKAASRVASFRLKSGLWSDTLSLNAADEAPVEYSGVTKTPGRLSSEVRS